ncbi:membrane protein [Roseibium aquae]|uniref:Membrane protein n=1 Tax=Roseibium aquae TaxID=1323746 RepID=A0A916TP55_9HYPH|nr:alpha-2-macroglobulin family protein [Roseibium aquae]GGB56321.1 membrane protein [Roseibium aquae]
MPGGFTLKSCAETLWLRAPRALLRAGLAAAFALGATAGAGAQDRRIVTIENADYFGSDYRTVQDVDLDSCKAVCLEDSQCRAFTYNTSAGWCFLKSDFGQLQSFQGAIAGRVVEVQAPRVTAEADRQAELAFLEPGLIDQAKTFAARIQQTTQIGAETAGQLREAGMQALRAGNAALAETDFRRLIVLVPNDFAAWLQLTSSLQAQNPNDWMDRQTKRDETVLASISAYLRAISENERAIGLDRISESLAVQENWKPAIKALRASLALQEDPERRRRYGRMIAEHGFRIVDHQVDSDAAAPRICLVFSQELPRGTDLSAYVTAVGQGSLSIESEDAQICIDGVVHGARYSVTARSGLPAADGERLENSARLSIYVRDRAPAAQFIGRAYVLPAGGEPTIPIRTVNTNEVDLGVYRIGDRSLADAVRDNRFLSQLRSYEADQIDESLGEKVWSGVIETGNRLNEDITTAIPVSGMGFDLRPGIYAMTARSKLDTENRWGPQATQWFLVSDLGLSAISAQDGLTANVRSLTTAAAVPGVTVRLVALNNEILGEQRTDDQGTAVFARGLTRGGGGMAPSLLVAETGEGDYSFLDLGKPAFDLSDRGVDGRPAPGPLDVFAWTDRGIYKAGDTVHIQALLRTDKAVAQENLPLTLLITRPDGVEHARVTVQDGGLGSHFHDLDLEPGAQQGIWSFAVHTDPDTPPLAQETFLVEDYQPERVDYALEADSDRLTASPPVEVSLSARFLYGSPAGDQRLEGEVLVNPTRQLPGHPGYQVGLLGDDTYPIRAALPGDLRTDAAGNLAFSVPVPGLLETTALYDAVIVTRLVEAGGRYVERSLDIPVKADGPRIGVKPAFEGGVDEGGPASFQIIAVTPDGARRAAEGLSWSLSRLDRRYQWYRTGGEWRYEPVTSARRVDSGTLTVSAEGPATLSVPVDWGEYRLEVMSEAFGAITQVEFSAGWYGASATSETPDYLDVALDRDTYRPGETAVLRLVPQMPGEAVIKVLAGGVAHSQTVAVGQDPVEVNIPVGEDWGAGVYVTASLYRPMDLADNRMPSRAVGLSWLSVNPEDRVLDVSVSAPDKIRPGTRLDVPVRLANLAAGTEAYVTVAAVDLGILNLTGYEAPAPETWYFGQHRLGAEIRDLYGQLIDRTLGTPGRVRSGGDAAAMRLDAPPPDEEPVALFSGSVKVGADGAATVTFDVPDFNGTLRIMAVAWSRDGVGHGVQDIEVRAPLVVSASAPRFLAPGDTTRVLVDIDNVEGGAGSYDLTLSAGQGLALTGDVPAVLDLGAGDRRQVSVEVTAGAELLRSAIVAALTGPDGASFVKTVPIDIRDTRPQTVRQSSFAVSAGGALVLDEGLIGDFRPGTVSVKVSSAQAARINVASLLGALDRYPYGCTEQVTSQSMPLLYLSTVAQDSGLGDVGDLRQKVETGISRVLANQSANGAFGLWNSYGSGDTWLDAYVTDFLSRADEQGFVVPARALTSALDNLENRLAYVQDFERGGEDIAYALYVLARNGRASIGDLRYYLDAKLNAFATPMAKAQLAAALSLYGETERATTGFDAAVAALSMPQTPWYRADYGSRLRDGAGVVTYAAASGMDRPLRNRALAEFADAQAQRQSYSTQDMAWMLLAARELLNDTSSVQLRLEGDADTGRIAWSFDGEDLTTAPARFVNEGAEAVDLLVSVTGQPEQTEPASGRDYQIERSFYDLDGNPLDPGAIPVNTRLAVVVSVRALSDMPGRLMVVDRIPAGLAIDNPRLVRSGDLAALDFLQVIDQAETVAFHADRFEVAVDQTRQGGDEMTFAYLARAVIPGDYAHPPASVEDMYHPDRRAVTAGGRMTIIDGGAQ